MTKKNSLKEAPLKKRWRWVRDADGIEVREDLGYELASYVQGEVEWVGNEPFYASLRLVNTSRGRSSSLFIWECQDTQTRYPMFISSMEDLVKNVDLRDGETPMIQWIVVKKGANYGIERFAG